jgi:hypothetical protein
MGRQVLAPGLGELVRVGGNDVGSSVSNHFVWWV